MNPSSASAVIASQFPHLAPVRAVPLGEGCDSIAFAVNDGWVPSFEFIGLASAEFPRAFCGYALLPGEPAIRMSHDSPHDAIAAAIAGFLSALHGVPLDDAIGAGVPRQPLAATLEELRADALSDLERVSEVDPAAPSDRWRAFLASIPHPGDETPAVLLHNDFAAEQYLLTVVRSPASSTGVMPPWGIARSLSPVCSTGAVTASLVRFSPRTKGRSASGRSPSHVTWRRAAAPRAWRSAWSMRGRSTSRLACARSG